MSLRNPAPDKVFSDSFLLCDDLHLICDDAIPGISDNTHTIHVAVKTR